jgi:predicted Ser/Thr protein kinase/tetratricopeptide (TPR) repeat protein
MDLEDLLEAHIAGERPDVPEPLRAEFDRAVAAHEMLRDAMGETILVGGKADDRPPPELPEDYDLVRELGRGGMGVVYLVRQKSLGRLVAVKVLRPGEATFGPTVRRFLEEARHLARLRHPHIVSIHEVGNDGHGEPYFTMDYVEGEPLTALLARGRLAPSQALAILRPAAEAVRHAHEKGIIHRDLKPGNILIDPAGRAYVTDFGLARDMAQAAGLTRTGEVMGTPAYMAPEQARGQGDLIGEATDVHALGAILYEMLTGRPPYGRDAPADIMVRLLREEPQPLRRLDRRVPRDLETIVMKCLAKEPSRRYTTVAALLEDLRRFEAGLPLQARRPGVIYHGWRLARRHWRPVVSAVVVAAMAIGAWSWLAPRLARTERLSAVLVEAQRRQAAGEPAVAARFYAAALDQNPPQPQRREILDQLGRCVAAIDEPGRALEIALPILDKAPNVSFGRYDGLVALAIAGRANAIEMRPRHDRATDRWYEAPARDDDRRVLDLAATRLDRFHSDEGGTEAEHRQADLIRPSIERKRLGEDLGPGVRTRPPLPSGTIEELLRQAGDPKLSRWDRGKASLVAGNVQEAAGAKQAALASYRRAYELIRSVHPTYATNDKGAAVAPIESPDPNDAEVEDHLIAIVFAAVRRLDPSTSDTLKGGLRFRIEGPPFPESVSIRLSPRINDPLVPPGETSTPKRWGFDAGVQVSLGGTRSAWIGVADGRYRISHSYSKEHQTSGPQLAEATRFFNLLAVDFPDWPEVEVRGDTIEMPPIKTRLMEEIKLLSPAEGTPIDLNEGFFRWSPVDGAAYYHVIFTVSKPHATGGVSRASHGGYKVTGTSLCLGVAPEQSDLLTTLRRELVPGATCGWDVNAYDAAGRRIGVDLGSYHPFVVARGLTGM